MGGVPNEVAAAVADNRMIGEAAAANRVIGAVVGAEDNSMIGEVGDEVEDVVVVEAIMGDENQNRDAYKRVRHK